MSLTISLISFIAVRYVVTGTVEIRKEPTAVSLAPTAQTEGATLAGGIEMSTVPYRRTDIRLSKTTTNTDNTFKFEGNNLPDGVTVLDVLCTDRRYLGKRKEVNLVITLSEATGDAGTIYLDRLSGKASWDAETTERVLDNAAETAIFLTAAEILSPEEAKDLYEKQASLAYVKAGMPVEFSTWAKNANERALDKLFLPNDQKDRLRAAFSKPTDLKGIGDLADKNKSYIDVMKSGGVKGLLSPNPTRDDIERFLSLTPNELDSVNTWKNLNSIRKKLIIDIAEPTDPLVIIKPDSSAWSPWIFTKNDLLDSTKTKLRFETSPNVRAFFIAQELSTKTKDPTLLKLLKEYIEKLKTSPGN